MQCQACAHNCVLQCVLNGGQAELYTFLAAYTSMGIVQYPSIKDYWQKDPVGLYGQALVSWMMSGRQFSDFYKCVAFEHPEKTLN